MTQRIHPHDLALWLRELAAMLRAGITPIEAMRATATSIHQPASTRRVAANAANRADAGTPFLDALQQGAAPVVSRDTRAALRAGFDAKLAPEHALQLAAALLANRRHTGEDPWIDQMRVRVVVILALAASGTFLFMLLPAQGAVARDMWPEWCSPPTLPSIRALIALAELTNAVPFPVAVLVAVALWLTLVLVHHRLGRTEQGALLLERLALSLPGLRRWTIQAAAARFFRLLSTLHAHRVPLPQAFRTARMATRSRTLTDTMGVAQEAIDTGAPLSVALATSGTFPETVCRLIAEAEIGNALGDTLSRLADTYEVDTHATRKRLQARTAICFTLGLALLVAWLIFGPPLHLLRTLTSLAWC